MKPALFLILVVLIATPCFAQMNNTSKTVIENGVTLGTVIAVVTSWSRYQSVLLAIFHGILSWLFVFYFVFTRERR